METLQQKLIKENHELRKEIELLKEHPIIKHINHYGNNTLVVNNIKNATIVMAINNKCFKIPRGEINLTDYFGINELINCQDLLLLINARHLLIVPLLKRIPLE